LAFRRFRRSFNRRPSGRFRRRRIRSVTETRQWEACNFNIFHANVDTSQWFTDVILVASIGNLFENNAAFSDGQAVVLGSTSRRLEIGGVVAESCMTQCTNADDEDFIYGALVFWDVWYIDNVIETEAGPGPANIPNWSVPQPPVSTTSLGDAQSDDSFPVRILSRRTWSAYPDFPSLSTNGIPRPPSTSQISVAPRINKRWRVSLGDKQALFHQVGCYDPTAVFAASSSYGVAVTGTLYWRLRF